MIHHLVLFAVPCFAGAPWNLEQHSALSGFQLRTMRLPDSACDLEEVADFIAQQVAGESRYVLIGDSFGAVASIALAVRAPPGLRALVLSGGFARNPITSPLVRMLVSLAPFFPGPFYRHLTLRYHAYTLRSEFDAEGDVPWSQTKTRAFFRKETSHRAYVNRANAVFAADYSGLLGKVNVPTLILTPEDDKLIGQHAAAELLRGIPGAREIVLPRTGHMFRFSHPGLYSAAVRDFLDEVVQTEPDEVSAVT